MAIAVEGGFRYAEQPSSATVSSSVHAGKTLAEVRQAEAIYLAERRILVGRRGLAGVEADPTPERVATSAVGLTLSGGGIRSATTNLGILQGLARMRLLPHVDYLCTVSGGGYIGGCLAALLSVNDDPTRRAGASGQYVFDGTRRPLFTTDADRFPFRDVPGPWPDRPVPPGPTSGKQEVKHLRTHGSFLVVRKGLFKTETLRSIGVLFSGIVFHWLLYLLAAAAVAALCLLFTIGLLAPAAREQIRQPPAVATPESALAAPAPGAKPPTVWKRMEPKMTAFGTTVAAAVRATRDSATSPFRAAMDWGAYSAVLTFLIAVLVRNVPVTPTEGESIEDTTQRVWLRWARRLGLVVIVAEVVSLRTAPSSAVGNPLASLLLPLALVLGFWVTCFGIYVLLPWTPLWSRAFRTVWASVQALATYGLVAATALVLFPFATLAIADVGGGAVIVAIVSALATRLLATRTAPMQRAPGWAWPTVKRGLLAVVVVAFMVLTVLLLAAWFVDWKPDGPKSLVPASIVSVARGGLAAAPDVVRRWAAGFTHREFLVIALGAIAALCVVGFLGNANRLALHYFYRDRLMETYLRTESTLPGQISLDLVHDATEIGLKELHGVPPAGSANRYTTCVTSAPYLIVSTAINLAERRDLTRKDRKSGYFTFSKLFCGSYHTSFAPTEEYQGGEVNLARAMTISGAAVGSGMGYHTFFAQAFATTLFNLRLGYWMENPGKPWKRLRQWAGRLMFSPVYLLREMMSWTHARGHLVNLSDGGHTGDNVGIYPLLQRRCRVIVACDAEADAGLSFGSFTEALRHAYIDMNIEVDIDLTMIRLDPATGLSRSHCAIGRIKYPPPQPDEPPPPAVAWLIYIKSSLTGDEPEPVKNYRVDHREFPHETTADQFFTDAQFESYRALGDHLAEHVFGKVFAAPNVFSPAWLANLGAVHSASRPTGDALNRHASGRLAAVEDALTRDAALAWYHEQCYAAPPWTLPVPAAPYPLGVSRAFLQQARLMEEMFGVLALGRHPNAPENRGWMRLFRMWARSAAFREQFQGIRATLSDAFIAFYDAYIALPANVDLDLLVPHPWDVALPPAIRIYLDPGRREAGL
jgi:hypothetical protein